MANQQRPPEREVRRTDGLAHDVEEGITRTATRMVGGHPELQGYLLLGAGALLLLFSFGYFTSLKWFIGAASILMILVGAARSHVVDRISEFISRFSK